MPFRSVYSKLALMPLAGNDVDYLDRHEHLLQSQSSLWSERKQISEGTNMSTLCSQALTAFRSQWPEDECISSSAKQKQRGQCDDARDVLMCLSAALFLEIFLMSFLVERHQNRFAYVCCTSHVRRMMKTELPGRKKRRSPQTRFVDVVKEDVQGVGVC